MCGIVFLSGPNAATRLPGCLDRLRHRGPDDQGVWIQDHLALGFTRLAINGQGPTGRQPYHNGNLVGAINGEIYNHVDLAITLGHPRSECDTQVFLPLLDLYGPRVIDELDGFYSAIAFRPDDGKVISLRDHIGKKPLFLGRSGSELFLTSELKAMEHIDWFKFLPCGVAMIDLASGSITQIAEHRWRQPQKDLIRLLEDAVRKRMPRLDQPVGVFLSGGVDSSLVAALVSGLRDDATYFTLGNVGGADRQAVELVVTALKLKDVRYVPLPSSADIPELVRSVVYTTESFNPSIVSNGMATFLLAEAAHEAGIKVVLTGEGADELFGGYHSFCEEEPWREIRNQLINDLHFTELRRLDMSCMAHGVEARCPFLDRSVRSYSDHLEYEHMYAGQENKIALRQCFDGLLPPAILHRRKVSFDVGSGTRRKVVQYLLRDGRSEREELRKLWQQNFSYGASAPYFHAYPAFDLAIDRRGATHR
jgi:asparagine synthase (glutamine-hydrolysing)